jgi:hypothetical protein
MSHNSKHGVGWKIGFLELVASAGVSRIILMSERHPPTKNSKTTSEYSTKKKLKDDKRVFNKKNSKTTSEYSTKKLKDDKRAEQEKKFKDDKRAEQEKRARVQR